nr:unnamed protein product [Digitaria exilis]
MYIPSLALLHAPLLSWCRAQPQRRRVTAVISDVFTGWARPLAEELGARHMTFSPCSALYIAIWRHLCSSGRSMPRNIDDGAGDDDELAIAWRQLSTEYQILKDGEEVSAPFVWATWTLTVLPEGFEAATASRGMVIRGWAPQVEILQHRALLEAVSAGVVMLTWPMGADHFVNRMLLREASLAVDVAEGADAVPDAIAAAVGDEGKPISERAVELGRKAVAAVAEGGSSHRDLQELIRLLANVD